MKKIGFIVLLLTLVSVGLFLKKDSGLTKVGIMQFARHTDLDDAKDGFIKSLSDDGFIDGVNIEIILEIASSDTIALNMQVKKLVRKSDLILAIGTPAAIAISNGLKDEGLNTPLLFTAVTDPVDAKLVSSLTGHNSNITGTTDITPIYEQVSLANQLKNNVNKIGVIYTASEVNSLHQAKLAKQAITDLGYTPILKSINAITDLEHVLTSLVSGFDKVDAIYIPSDNLLSSSMGNFKSFNERRPNNKVPIIASTTFQVEEGAAITLGLNYYNLGVQTGNMAVKILSGVDIKTIDVESSKDLELAINLDTFKIIGLEPSKELISRADLIYGGN
ncbi:MAG TPA: ABC transporter substrate-binding protein [Haploplasma sp.]|nr:ABC transporter substrate-binding protein [Haploplasma sp.]